MKNTVIIFIILILTLPLVSFAGCENCEPFAPKQTPIEVQRLQTKFGISKKTVSNIPVNNAANKNDAPKISAVFPSPEQVPDQQSAIIIKQPMEPVAKAAKKEKYSKAYPVVHAGSLKTNIQRLAKQMGWPQVVWNVPNDYVWVGTTRIKAHSISGVLYRLLANYPLQAVFYAGNHILVIRPRTLQ